MKRPEHIPSDVWETLTLNDAANAGLLGSVPSEWLIVGGSALICDTGEDALVASMLRKNVNADTAFRASAIVRRRQVERFTTAVEPTGHPTRQGTAMDPLEHARFVAALFGTTDDEAGRVKRERAERALNAKEESKQSPPRLPARDRTRDKPNRPRRIPADIWDAMTVREACDHEFFSRPNDGRDLHLNTCLHMFPTDSFIGQSIARKLKRIDDRTLEIRFRVIREERAQRRQASCQKHEFAPGGDACVHCGMIIYAPAKRIRGAKADMVLVDDHVVLERAKRADRCTKHEVYTMNGIAYCSLCNASESEIVDDIADESDAEKAKMAYVIARARIGEQQKQQDIRPTASAPNSSPKFREDICRNDRPLLPPFEAGEPTDRVTVRMLYPYIARVPYAGEMQESARCALTLHELGNRFIEYRRRLSGPSSGFSWISHPHEATAARTRIASDVLSFDLAVRTGEYLAVAAYGLILFALAVGAEREREHARAAICAADDAMDAVFRAAREVSEADGH